jgi:O-antigen ligase
MGIPHILENPLGHGPGGSGAAMGYSADAFITIDNYYLSLGLDYGFIGLFMFLAIFLLTITAGFRATLRASKLHEQELSLIIPLSIAMSEFLVIKLVFSQQDNHPLVFAMLGMLVALIWRAREATESNSAAAPNFAHAPRPKPRSKLLSPAPARSPEWR